MKGKSTSILSAAKRQYGSRIIELLLSCADHDRSFSEFTHFLASVAKDLSTSRYGNFVVQKMLKLEAEGRRVFGRDLLDELPSLVDLSFDKHGRFVVLTKLALTPPDKLASVLRPFLEGNRLQDLSYDTNGALIFGKVSLALAEAAGSLLQETIETVVETTSRKELESLLQQTIEMAIETASRKELEFCAGTTVALKAPSSVVLKAS